MAEKFRENILSELKAKSVFMIEDAKKWEIHEQTNKNLKTIKTHQTTDGHQCHYLEMSVDGVMPDEYKHFYQNYICNAKAVAPENFKLQ